MLTDDPRFKEAQAFIHEGRKTDAAKLLKPLVKAFPNEPRVWRMLAQIAPDRSIQEDCLKRAEALESTAAPPVPKPTQAPIREAQALKATRQAAALRPRRKVASPPPKKPASRPVPVTVPPTTATRSRWWMVALPAVLLLLAIPGFFYVSPLLQQDGSDPLEPEAIAVIDDLETPIPTPTASATSEPTESATKTASPQSPTSIPSTETPTPAGLEPKKIVSLDVPRERWTPTPSPTPTLTPTPTLEPTAVIQDYVLYWPEVGENERWVDVNLTEQILTAYEGRTIVFQTPISSGLAPNFTVTGQFRIYYRLETQTMDGRRLGFDYVTPNVPHVQYFYGDFALHGAYWHENFGQPMSHGCVNLSPADAEWLYAWTDYGTLVNVHY